MFHSYSANGGYQQHYAPNQQYAEHQTGYSEYEAQRGPTGAQPPSYLAPTQSNPFLQDPEHPNLEISNSRTRNSHKKRQQLALPTVPRVPQPMGNATQGVIIHQVLGAAPTIAPTPGPSPQPLAPPGQQWILVANPTPASVEMQPPVLQVPQPAKPKNAQPAESMDSGVGEKPKSQEKLKEPKGELKMAQMSADKLQMFIKASKAYLLEQRLRYPLSQIGIIEAYLPQKKIKTICRVSTIGSLFISGLPYLKIH